MECVLETKAVTILEFIQGRRGNLALTFEEGTRVAWRQSSTLLLKPHVSRLVVCDPRKNALLKEANQNGRIDARKLAERLRTSQVHAVYHRKDGTRALKEADSGGIQRRTHFCRAVKAHRCRQLSTRRRDTRREPNF